MSDMIEVEIRSDFHSAEDLRHSLEDLRERAEISLTETLP